MDGFKGEASCRQKNRQRGIVLWIKDAHLTSDIFAMNTYIVETNNPRIIINNL